MAASSFDILGLDEARVQCRADEGEAIDMLLEQAVRSAVDYVSTRTLFPLIDRDQTFNEMPDAKDRPLRLRRLDVKKIRSIKFWTPDQEEREEPGGAVDLSTLGRRHEDKGRTVIWPPSGGWPDRLNETPFEVTVQVGYDLDDENEADEEIRQAIILMTRHFYESPDRFESEFAVYSLLEGIRSRRYGEFI